MASTMGSPRHGMKQDIEDIQHKLQEHDDALARIDVAVQKNAVSQRKPEHDKCGLNKRMQNTRNQRAPRPPGRLLHFCHTLIPPIPSLQALSDDNIKAVQASLKASLASLRDEMNRKLQSLTIELAQVQKQLNVQRGASWRRMIERRGRGCVDRSCRRSCVRHADSSSLPITPPLPLTPPPSSCRRTEHPRAAEQGQQQEAGHDRGHRLGACGGAARGRAFRRRCRQLLRTAAALVLANTRDDARGCSDAGL
jgi:hypothetical protein